MRVYAHTAGDKIIAISDNLRIPKSYFRFEGLMVKLFNEGVVKSEEGVVLMEIAEGSFKSLIESIEPEKVVGLSTTGVKSNAEQVAQIITGADECAVVVGGFPKGHFAESTTRQLGPTYSINQSGLEAHVVIARVIYECEKLLEKRVDHEGDE